MRPTATDIASSVAYVAVTKPKLQGSEGKDGGCSERSM